MRADTQWTELLTCRIAGNRDLSIFLSLKDAFTTSAWKPFRRASESFARNMAKPSFVALATGKRSPTTQVNFIRGASKGPAQLVASLVSVALESVPCFICSLSS